MHNSNNSAPQPRIVPHYFAPQSFNLELQLSKKGMANDEIEVSVSNDIWIRLPNAMQARLEQYYETLKKVKDSAAKAREALETRRREPSNAATDEQPLFKEEDIAFLDELEVPLLPALLRNQLIKVTERDSATSKEATFCVSDNRVAAFLHQILSKNFFMSCDCGRITVAEDASTSKKKGPGGSKSKKKAIPDPKMLNMDKSDFEAIEKVLKIDASGSNGDADDGDDEEKAKQAKIACPELEEFRRLEKLCRKNNITSATNDVMDSAEPFIDVFDKQLVLDFIEKKVKHAGWLDEDDSPSCFALAVRMFHRCGFSYSQLEEFLKSSKLRNNRPFAKLALAVYARYILSPEDFAVCVVPLYFDDTIVDAAEDDMFDPVSVEQYATKLVEDDNVYQAFLPIYNDTKHCVLVMRAIKLRKGEMDRLKAQEGRTEEDDKEKKKPPTTGSTLMGFKDIKTMMRSFEESKRRLEQKLQLDTINKGVKGAGKRGGLGGLDSDDDALLDEGEDDDMDYFVDRNGRDAAEDEGTNYFGGGSVGDKRHGVEADTNNAANNALQHSKKKKRREQQMVNKLFYSQHTKALLELAGREKPFKENDPLYFEF